MSADQPPERQVDDPEEAAQSARIRALINRRERALDAAREAEQAAAAGDASPEQARLFVLSELRSLIMDLWPKLRSEYNGRYLGAGYMPEDAEESPVHIGAFTIPVPDSLPSDRRDKRLAPGAEPAEPKRIAVNGLAWFVDHDFPKAVQWEVRTETGGFGVQQETVAVVPDTTILMRGINVCSEFMDNLGIDLEVSEDGLPTIRGFDQSREDADNQLARRGHDDSPEL